MADARFNKYGQRSDWHKPQPQLDSPLFHGWTKTGETELGHTVFKLGTAQMRSTGPEDNCQFDWLVSIGEQVYGYNGSLSQITADVRVMLGLPEQPYFLAGQVIPITAFGGNK